MAAPVTSAKSTTNPSDIVETAFYPTAGVDWSSGYTANSGGGIIVMQRRNSGSGSILYPAPDDTGGFFDVFPLAATHTTASSQYKGSVFLTDTLIPDVTTITFGAGAHIAVVVPFVITDSGHTDMQAEAVRSASQTSGTSGSAPADHNLYTDPNPGVYDLIPMLVVEVVDGSTPTAITEDGTGDFDTFNAFQFSDPLDGAITYRIGYSVYRSLDQDFSINFSPNVSGVWPSTGRSWFWALEGGWHQVATVVPEREYAPKGVDLVATDRRVGITELPYQVDSTMEEGDLWP